jgi:hypothetical protein
MYLSRSRGFERWAGDGEEEEDEEQEDALGTQTRRDITSKPMEGGGACVYVWKGLTSDLARRKNKQKGREKERRKPFRRQTVCIYICVCQGG